MNDWESLEAERRCERLLLSLLARCHRDGGHHTGEVGLEQSVVDADEKVADAYARLEAIDREALPIEGE